jgi:hypothetical protein
VPNTALFLFKTTTQTKSIYTKVDLNQKTRITGCNSYPESRLGVESPSYYCAQKKTDQHHFFTFKYLIVINQAIITSAIVVKTWLVYLGGLNVAFIPAGQSSTNLQSLTPFQYTEWKQAWLFAA